MKTIEFKDREIEVLQRMLDHCMEALSYASLEEVLGDDISLEEVDNITDKVYE